MKRKSKHSFPTRYLLLILTGLCVLVMFVSFTLNLSGGPLNTVAGYVFTPMQKGINSVGTWFISRADELKSLKAVMQENEELQAKVDELTTELNTIKLEQYELDNLRELMQLDQKYPSYDKVAARIIGSDTSNWFNIGFSNLNCEENAIGTGEQLVTSNISDKYLEGILIGYISSIERDSNNLTYSGTVTPAVDFKHLQEVLVILDKKQAVE